MEEDDEAPLDVAGLALSRRASSYDGRVTCCKHMGKLKVIIINLLSLTKTNIHVF